VLPNGGDNFKRGADVFGRQLSNTARDVSRGIGSAQRIVSKIEQAVPDGVPVLDAGLKALSSGLKAGQQTADLARVGGIALRNASQGNAMGLASNARQASGLVGQIGQNATSAVTQGGSALAQGAMFL
jgi:hypothetical protein